MPPTVSGRALCKQQQLARRHVQANASRKPFCRAKRSVAAKAKDVKERSVKDVKAGFRWDPAYSRWVRDEKMAGKVDAPVTIKTKSGGEYTVRPLPRTRSLTGPLLECRGNLLAT